MSETKSRAIILVPLAVIMVLIAFLLLGYLLTIAFQLPSRLNLSTPIRVIGVLTLLLGLLFLGWFFRHRRPTDVLVSTYVTFSKMVRGVRLEERSFRTEPLVVKGPYRYVRHPLYSGVLVLLAGWWLLLDYSFLLVSTLLAFVWFTAVVTPFEEKELRAIFGEDYELYAREVPRMIPFIRFRSKKRHLWRAQEPRG